MLDRETLPGLFPSANQRWRPERHLGTASVPQAKGIEVSGGGAPGVPSEQFAYSRYPSSPSLTEKMLTGNLPGKSPFKRASACTH